MLAMKTLEKISLPNKINNNLPNFCPKYVFIRFSENGNILPSNKLLFKSPLNDREGCIEN